MKSPLCNTGKPSLRAKLQFLAITCAFSFSVISCTHPNATNVHLNKKETIAKALPATAEGIKRPPVPKTYLKEHDVVKWIAAHNGSVTFVSQDSQATDHDAMITLANGNKAVVELCGYAVTRYAGTFETDSTGLIRLKLKDYHPDWPEMYLFRTAKSALLLRRDQSPSGPFDSHGRPLESRGFAPNWPFRFSGEKAR